MDYVFINQSKIKMGNDVPMRQRESTEIFNQLPQNKYWGYDDFKRTLILLSQHNGFLPNKAVPESIHLQGIRRPIDELEAQTRSTGSEYARAIFVDIDKRILILGKTTKGSESQTRLNLSTQPGREQYQVCVGSMHTHPANLSSMLTAHGLSDQDYVTFLSDPAQQMMMVVMGQTRIMVIKTNLTQNLSHSRITHRIQGLKSEHISNGHKISPLDVIKFNAYVCLEFGIVMYKSLAENPDFFKNIYVTNHADV